MSDERRVQWCRGYASGARSWAAHGIGKVHLRDLAVPHRTLCGVVIPGGARRFVTPDKAEQGNDCKRCVLMDERG